MLMFLQRSDVHALDEPDMDLGEALAIASGEISPPTIPHAVHHPDESDVDLGASLPTAVTEDSASAEGSSEDVASVRDPVDEDWSNDDSDDYDPAEDLDAQEFADDKPRRRRKRPYVLGRAGLIEIASDMRATILPSWITKGPVHLGKKAHGKLSADAWRTVCTVHFVITLIRLWGWIPPESLEYKALANFLLLVQSATLATRRTTNYSRRKQLHTVLSQYLLGILHLYKTSLETNQHMALHLPYFLNHFGPPHSWWAFPYERFNGMLQKIKTNNLFGV